MQGGKKKGKGGKGKGAAAAAAAEEPKVLSNVVMFVGTEFPEMQIQVFEILKSCDYDENNQVIEKQHVQKIKETFKNKKDAGNAMKIAAFVLEEVAKSGPEKALQLKVPFDEQALIEANKTFLFDGMTTIQNIKVVLSSDAEAIQGIEGAALIASSATPGKPASMFF